jgi:SAM-dependent methyltransferase
MSNDGSFREEANRVQKVYASRKEHRLGQLYDPMTAAGLWSQVEVDRHMLWGLSQLAPSLEVLTQMDILEVGCGSGGHLLRLLSLGVPPSNLHGIDLLPDRIKDATSMHEGVDFRLGNAVDLPWANGSMDVVMQFTCLSSVLDEEAREAIAQEMLRVLKPGGGILSFDFVWNPNNRDTVGIGSNRLKGLFPGARINTRRVFLAPPIARKLLPQLRLLTTILDAIPWLCFHRIALIKPHG